MGKRARVSLRVNPDVDPKTHPYISTGLKKNKFGISEAEVLEVVRSLNQLPGIHLKGLSIHIGSQLLSLAPLDDAFGKLQTLMSNLDQHLDRPLEMVDLGGGIGITYRNEKAPSIQKYCKLIQKHFGKRLSGLKKFKLLIEPGRALSGNAGVLVSEVLYRKQRSKKDFLIIDAAMNDLMRPALYESYHEIIPIQQKHLLPNDTKSKNYLKTNIVGPVCESSDSFATDRPFSSQVSPGDLIAILSAGAYGFSMSSTYNSRPRPAEVLIEDGKYKVIRSREKWEDLIRGED
jgi:diaminopimelate decarboxylase